VSVSIEMISSGKASYREAVIEVRVRVGVHGLGLWFRVRVRV